MTTLSSIQVSLQNGTTTCRGLVNHYLEKIESNLHLNAFLEVYADEALNRADEIDQKIKNGQINKLSGMVIGIKDVLCYKNHRVSASSKILAGFSSIYSATVIDKLLAEDAIIIGRLNCDEFAMGSSNENSAYGNVLNPLDNSRVPGGSSGGSVVAVAAGLCLVALGTDTGGSIRQPASFCGVYGMKPTYGRVSRYGMVAYASSFDQIGPIANSVEDLAIVLEVISGKDEYDSTVSNRSVPAYSRLLETKGKYKVAFLKDCIEHPALDKEIYQKMMEVIENLRKDDHSIDAAEFPFLDYMVPAYYVLTTAEASSNLSRFDGIRYGYRSPNATDIESTYKLSRTEGFGNEVKRRIMLGTFVLSAGYYDAYYGNAQKVRRMIQDKTNEILQNHDFIIMPTTPKTAFRIGERSDPVSMYLEDIFTVQAPLAGLPAISLPLGIHSNGLPFGIQVIGRKFEEERLLAFSKLLVGKEIYKEVKL